MVKGNSLENVKIKENYCGKLYEKVSSSCSTVFYRSEFSFKALLRKIFTILLGHSTSNENYPISQ